MGRFFNEIYRSYQAAKNALFDKTIIFILKELIQSKVTKHDTKWMEMST